jgi:polysaccharide transporter, PST family
MLTGTTTDRELPRARGGILGGVLSSGAVRILENVGWLTFDRVLRMGVGLVLTVWIARFLGPAGYGLLSYALSFTGLFTVFACLGLRGIVIRDIVHHPQEAHVTLGTALVLRLLAAAPVYAVILWAYAALRPGDSYGLSMVAIVAAPSLFQAFDLIDHWNQARVQSRYSVWASSASFTLCSLIRLALLGWHAPLRAFAWAILLESVLTCCGLILLYHWSGNRILRWRCAWSRAKGLLSDSWPLLFESLMVVIYLKIDQVMLGLMVNDAAVGIYSAAARVSEVWYFIPVAIVDSVTPAIFRSKQVSERLYYARLARLFSFLVLVSLAISVPLAICAPLVIRGLFGASYAAAVPILAVHIWAAPFVFLGVAQNPWNINEGLTVLYFKRTALGAASNVILNLILIPRFGGLGAAVATVVSYAAAGVFANVLDVRTRGIFWLQLRAFAFRGLFT